MIIIQTNSLPSHFRWLCPIEKQSVTNALSANSLRFAQIYFFAMCLFYTTDQCLVSLCGVFIISFGDNPLQFQWRQLSTSILLRNNFGALSLTSGKVPKLFPGYTGSNSLFKHDINGSICFFHLNRFSLENNGMDTTRDVRFPCFFTRVWKLVANHISRWKLPFTTTNVKVNSPTT